MGIAFSQAVLLVKAKQNKVCFDKILTIGHQTLLIPQKQLKQLAKFCGLKIDTSVFSHGDYADKFFEKFLDAKRVTSLDY